MPESRINHASIAIHEKPRDLHFPSEKLLGFQSFPSEKLLGFQSFPSEKFLGFQSFPSEKLLGFQSKFRGRKRCSGSENIKLNPQTMKDFSKIFQAIFARILQSADKFCRIFPCKMSEFSMFCKKFGCMHARILHVLSVRLTRDCRGRRQKVRELPFDQLQIGADVGIC